MAQPSRNQQGAAYAVDRFRDEQDVLREIRTLGTKYGIREVLPIRAEDICVAEWVRLKCRYGCKMYGSSWCCAPETPEPQKVRAILSEYSKALLLCATISNEQFYRDNQKKRRKQVNSWKGTIALERHLFLLGYYKAFALVAERCALCRECAYPEPCKFPQSKRPSVESFAIDVFATIENIGKRYELASNVSDEYNCYSIILME
ncbi:MAG: DUF2284 domain-containing protein [Deferrisomatales bacterium]